MNNTKFIYPFKEKYKITSKFGERFDSIFGEYWMHNGIDIGVLEGTETLAISDGIIIKVWNDDLNGNAIRLLTSDGNYIIGYAHLQIQLVEVGNIVKKGDDRKSVV